MIDTKTLEELKDPKKAQAFGIYKQYHSEKADILEKVGKENLLYHDPPEWRQKDRTAFFSFRTYILKPDYQPEPEYVDLEIIKRGGWLGVWRLGNRFLPKPFTHLYCLPSLPGFQCFWHSNDDKFSQHAHVNIDVVASLVRQSCHKVYARFRRES
jgi:hypothetical protein